MANKALPLLLLGGVAILAMSGGGESEEGPFDRPPPPGSSGDLILTAKRAIPKDVEQDILLYAQNADPKEVKKEGNRAVKEEKKADQKKTQPQAPWKDPEVGDVGRNNKGQRIVYWGTINSVHGLPGKTKKEKNKHANWLKQWHVRPKKKNVKKAVAAAILTGGAAGINDAYVQFLLWIYKNRRELVNKGLYDRWP